MKIFISWSKPLSRQIATAVYNWLPIVIQNVQPFMSAEEIEIGTRWSAGIFKELESSKFGIICLTPENLLEPWIYFEAGALAKVVEQARVVPLLFNLKPSDIQGPLTQFQATGFEKDDISRLLKSINSAAGEEALEENRLEMAFSALWGKFDDAIRGIDIGDTESNLPSAKTFTGIEPILEEILVLSRQQAQSSPQLETVKAIERLIQPQLIEIQEFLRDRGVNANHPAWFDLASAWLDFRDRWRAAEMAPVREDEWAALRKCVGEMELPIELLLRQHPGVRRAAMERARRFAEVASPEVERKPLRLRLAKEPE